MDILSLEALICVDADGGLKVTDIFGNKHLVSHRYGWSKHNCSCRGRKTGLVLYPYDIRYKNVVLLVCENCYGYGRWQGTQHDQLQQWYYNIYNQSKGYRLVSGFSLKDDGSFGFNSISKNAGGPYTDDTRAMGVFEQQIVRNVVNHQLQSCGVKVYNG